MTRKRKNVEETTPSTIAQNYGYVDEGGNQSQHTKKGGFEKRSKPWMGKRDFNEGDINEKYGAVGERREGKSEQTAVDDDSLNGQQFPSEVVAYLKNLMEMIGDEPMEKLAIEKCCEEVSGLEETLLKFPDACRVVEDVFGRTQHGSFRFLSALLRIKHKKVLQLIYSGCGEKTIEKLLYSLTPVQKDAVQVLTTITELLMDNLDDVLQSPSACFLLRSLARVLCGSPPRQEQQSASPVEPSKTGKSPKEVQLELRTLLERLSTFILDYKLMKDHLRIQSVSLVIQDVLDCVSVGGKSKLIDLFVDTALETAGENTDSIILSWRGRFSSRVWEKIVQVCSEDARLRLWMMVASGKSSELAQHEHANFPLQKLISNVNSLELATDVVDDLLPSLSSLLSSNRMGVVIAIVDCVKGKQELEETLLDELMKYFNADEDTNKSDFLFNILSMNSCDPASFTLESVKPQSSYLLEALLRLSSTLALCSCVESLSPSQIFEMACHRNASHFLEALLNSPNVTDQVKLRLFKAFEDSWPSLIANQYGSHVFETLWDSSVFTIDRKMAFMKKIIYISNPSKFWKFMLLRTDMNLFKKDNKEWMQKWIKGGGGVKKEKKLKMQKRIQNRAEKRKTKRNKNKTE